MRVRKIPLRKCVACQEMKPKKELIRIVKTPEDEIMIDPTGKKSGRGAYLCVSGDCFAKARQNKALEKSLKTSIRPEIYDQLLQDFPSGTAANVSPKGNRADG
jgi:hypothetical protein